MVAVGRLGDFSGSLANRYRAVVVESAPLVYFSDSGAARRADGFYLEKGGNRFASLRSADGVRRDDWDFGVVCGACLVVVCALSVQSIGLGA